ncbi:MAG TPA: AI-2E family transporter, partial [Acidimicrobiales bacterium]|nr:AI-2E family transporter [Acidimicrobiales bacterium]
LSRSLRVAVAFSSVLALLLVIVVTFAVREVLSDARHTLALFAAAGISAILLAPLVELLQRWMRRVVAVGLAVVLVVGLIGVVAWGVLGDINHQVDRLQEAAPSAAAKIEQSERFGKAAREFRLEERVTEAVDRLSPDTAQQAQAAARRVATYTVGFILMLFLLSWGPRMGQGALAQISDERRRMRIHDIGISALRNGRAYLLLALAQALVIGFVSWLVCRVADVPAPAPLGLIIGVTSLMPYLGIVIGSIPALLLSAGFRSFAAAGVLLAVFLGMQAGQILLQRRLRKRVIYVGPAMISIVFLLGYDVYGIGGALFGTAIAVFAMSVADAVGTDDPETDVLAAQAAPTGAA